MAKYFILALLGLVSLSSCLWDDDGPFNCVDGNGPTVSETINLPDFQGIEMNISADVYLTQGPVQEVVVEGQENIIDLLERDVDNGVWEIEFEDCVHHSDDLKIYITLPELVEVTINGSGDVMGQSVFATDEMDLRISGSGDISLEAVADSYDITITGSGDMELDGSCEDMDIDISGSGDLNAFGLLAQTADINISGSGECEVSVSQSMDVTISGSGDVYYKGNPSINVNISGSGQVIDSN